MNKFVYLVHAEIIKDLTNNPDDTEKYTFAFLSSEKAEEYIKEEAEIFNDKRHDYNFNVIYSVNEPGFFNAIYMNGSKVENFKMWYERVPLVEE